MISHCGQYVVTFNGEIYNFQEIKSNLVEMGHEFRTSSDTEVLLAAFKEYGIDCINQFVGMFAFGLYDGTNDEYFIVRDRLGIKPLYYMNEGGRLVFSSEIKSILSLDGHRRTINMNAVSSYLSFRYPILNDTFFEGINSLAPAHYIKIKAGSIEIFEYWNVRDKFKEQKIDKGEDYYIEKTRRLLKTAVEYRMISDVPFGAFLSGGVDSSIVTALMANASDNPIKTFTIGSREQGYNEFSYANMVAKCYKTEHKEIIVNCDDYIKTMENLISYKDAPISVPNEVPLYLMSIELKKYITVVLSGEGADEIFGGYGRIFRSPYDLERIRKISLYMKDSEKEELFKAFFKKYGVATFASEIDHFMNIYSYTSFDDKKKLLDSSIDLKTIEGKLTEKFMNYFDELEDDSYYNKMMYAFEKIHIVGLLHRVDTATMATSVEARVPFVDHRLVEFAFTIPVKYKLKWKSEEAKTQSKLLMSDKISEVYDTPKYLLKKAFEDLVPADVLYRKKMGFPVPLNNWFGGYLNNYAKKILLNKKACSRGIYNTKNIRELLEDPQLRKDHGAAMKVWMLINIELFLRKYMN
jgi:asparagine synthase (glutamine-hydrolysing)